MPRYLSPPASGKVSVAICGRCKKKVQYNELREDGNIPGLMVCGDPGCWDTIDPYRLPQRKTEDVSINHPRPDEPLE